VFSLLVVGLAAISMIATALVPGSPPYREADVWALLLATLGPLSLLASRFPLGPAPEPALDRPARELLPALTGAGTVSRHARAPIAPPPVADSSLVDALNAIAECC